MSVYYQTSTAYSVDAEAGAGTRNTCCFYARDHVAPTSRIARSPQRLAWAPCGGHLVLPVRRYFTKEEACARSTSGVLTDEFAQYKKSSM